MFFGYCNECHLRGHSARNCPKLGKGFKGNCKGCGTAGHTLAQCPYAAERNKGKGKGKSGMNSLDEGIDLGGGCNHEHSEQPDEDSLAKIAENDTWGYNYDLGNVGLVDTFEGKGVSDIFAADNMPGWTTVQRNRKGNRSSKSIVERLGKPKEGHEWVLFKPSFDTGAVDSLADMVHATGYAIRETRASKMGLRCSTAGDGFIYL